MTSMAARVRRLRLSTIVTLTLVWVLLWGTWSLGNLLNGLLLAVGTLLLLPLPEVSLGGRPHPPEILRFAGRFLLDLVRSSIQISWMAVRPGPQDVSSIIAVRLRSGSELVMTMTAEALSLVPGSIMVEVDAGDQTLYAHVLSAPDDAAVEAFRQRVLDVEGSIIRAIGRPGEIALLTDDRRKDQR